MTFWLSAVFFATGCPPPNRTSRGGPKSGRGFRQTFVMLVFFSALFYVLPALTNGKSAREIFPCLQQRLNIGFGVLAPSTLSPCLKQPHPSLNGKPGSRKSPSRDENASLSMQKSVPCPSMSFHGVCTSAVYAESTHGDTSSTLQQGACCKRNAVFRHLKCQQIAQYGALQITKNFSPQLVVYRPCECLLLPPVTVVANPMHPEQQCQF